MCRSILGPLLRTEESRLLGPGAGTTCQILPRRGRVWMIQGRKKSRPPRHLPILDPHVSGSGTPSVLLGTAHALFRSAPCLRPGPAFLPSFTSRPPASPRPAAASSTYKAWRPAGSWAAGPGTRRGGPEVRAWGPGHPWMSLGQEIWGRGYGALKVSEGATRGWNPEKASSWPHGCPRRQLSRSETLQIGAKHPPC